MLGWLPQAGMPVWQGRQGVPATTHRGLLLPVVGRLLRCCMTAS